MKVWAVNYISTTYNDGIVELFLTKEKALNWINTMCPEYDRVNYYVTEWEVNE